MISENPVHKILELFNNLVQVHIVTSKTTLDIQYEKPVNELPRELLNYLRLRILEN